MKNFTFLAFAFFSLLSISVNAQIKKCITEEKMQELFRTDPQARIRFENTRRLLDEQVRAHMSNTDAQLFRTNAIINIPVVVHILTSNPNLVTDAIVQSQIDTLNWYYGGAPSGDSLRVYTPFRTSYGRSQIRFCMAQRTPGGVSTNGIERLTTATTFNGSSAHPSTIVPAWNTQNYLNMWVVSFGTSGILGYSYKPGTFPPGSQSIGYVVDYRAFGSGPGTSSGGYHFDEYNQGKTGVHEIGHYFNLDHPWGPNNSGNPTCTLDDGCTDTPQINGPFFGCPTASQIPVLSTACTGAAPGTMWQNHMDYADDACMVLFTLQQVAKMETALNTSSDRNTLLTSNGCQPIVASPNDAGITAIINPASANVYCAPAVTPQITLKNFGSNTLTSVSINLTINGVAQAGYPFSWVGSLSANSSINVTLPAINLVSGNNLIAISTSLPNGVADGNPANDAASVTVSMPTASTLPFIEGFEATTFPPAGWTLNNPDGSTTWVRYTAATAASGLAMSRINFYNYGTTNQIDELITPPINAAAAGAGSKFLEFSRAYRQYGTAATDQDTLEILVSADCGATYTSVWKKWGASLATVAGTPTTSYAPTSTADWIAETINVTPYATGGMRVKFKGTNRFGQNLYLDNINIQKQGDRDLKLVSINTPGSTACSQIVSPQVTVMNNGLESILSFDISYRIGTAPAINQTVNVGIAPGASVNLTLAPSTAPIGNNQITAYTSNPVGTTGTGDIQKNNDTLRKNFTVVNLVMPPVVEGFENAFPPAGWSIINPDNAVTWTRKSPGRNSTYSAYFDNFTAGVTNQNDDIRSPFFNVAGADSLTIAFDLAHKNYNAAANSDTLSVLVSTDCGNTYTTVYKKWGSALATAGSLNTNYAAPAQGDWRNERISLNNVFTTNGSVNILVRNTSRFGNNIFVDNINIGSVYKRDAQVLSINTPSTVVCSGSLTPVVTIRNAGIETITGVKVSYSVDNGAAQTTTLTGINLTSNSQTNVNLNAANIATLGAHTIRIYSWEPVTSSGIGDMNTSNDTLTKTFSIAGNVNAPLTESFEGTSFPPANWTVTNPDNNITWKRNAAGRGNIGSAYLNTFNYAAQGQKDDLASPNVNFSGVDSVQLSFDLAAATYSHPGTTGIPLDTLEVLVTKDCGATYTTVYKKWGEDLQTVSDPNNPQPTQFTPSGDEDWRKEIIDLTSFGGSGPLMFVFRTTNNFENNIFVDNVNLTTRVLPEKIKQQGYLVLPTPFRNSFSVWHVQKPTALKYINVFNAAGQLIWTKQFSSNGEKVEMVDLTGKAAGVYVVNIGYNDGRNISERVVKY